MTGELWKRPSSVVVATAVAVVGYFAARGQLVVGAPLRPVAVGQTGSVPAGTPRVGETARAPSPGPVPPTVVRASAGGRSLLEPRALVRGRVYDRSGFRIVGAEIAPFGEGLAKGHTGADGEFALDLPVPPPPLLVQAPGCRALWFQPQAGAPEPCCVQLPPAAPWDQPEPAPALPVAGLFGEGLVFGADGRPLVGAFVTALGGAAWTETDELGRFTLALPSGTASLLVHAPSAAADGAGAALRAAPLQLPRAKGRFPVPDLHAVPAAALRGTLRDGGGNPVAGAALRVSGAGLQRVVETGMSGLFRLGGLLPGRYEVQPLGHRGALGRRQEVVLDRPLVDCEMQLVAAHERRVRVVDTHGEPCGGVHIAAAFDGERCSVATADADGWAALQLVDGAVEFEVRDDAARACAVQHYDVEQGRLVVTP
jgi:hypothetical protein